MARRGLMNAPEPEEQGNVAPEEQQAYDQFVSQGMKLIFNEQTLPSLLKMIDGDGDPVIGLASAATNVIMRLVTSEGAPKFDPAVLLHGGTEILEILANAAEESKLHDFTPEELQQAELRTLDMVRDQMTKAGLIDGEALKGEFAQIAQADKEGSLDQMLPGLEKAEGPEDEPNEEAPGQPEEDEPSEPPEEGEEDEEDDQ